MSKRSPRHSKEFPEKLDNLEVQILKSDLLRERLNIKNISGNHVSQDIVTPYVKRDIKESCLARHSETLCHCKHIDKTLWHPTSRETSKSHVSQDILRPYLIANISCLARHYDTLSQQQHIAALYVILIPYLHRDWTTRHIPQDIPTPYLNRYTSQHCTWFLHGLAAISRLLIIIGLLCRI